MKKKTYLYVGGKSGGHITPCITLAKKVHTTHPHITPIFIAADTALDKTILKHQNHISTTYFLPFHTAKKTIFNIITFLYSLFFCLYICLKHHPEKIISSGGAVSLPICIIGYILRIPIDLYELNVIPGKAILFLSSFAQTIFVCFQKTKDYFPNKKCVITHYPIRYSSCQVVSKSSAYKTCNLSEKKKTIMIIGGSQGSQFLNKILHFKNKNHFIDKNKVQIIHLVGNNDPEKYKKWYKKYKLQHYVKTYEQNMIPLYCSADIVISRAGAGILSELLFFRKKTIIIPLETHTTSHQKNNAWAYTESHPDLFCVIEEKNIKHNYALFKNRLKKYLETSNFF